MKIPSHLTLCLLAVLAVAPAAGGAVTADTRDPYARERCRMLEEIALLTRETRVETGRAALAERVRQAIAKVPRHEFVPTDQKANAYQNRPLPIGHGQTISQPFIVALMTDIMEIKPTDKVLEIGTGSGYQAAVLAELAGAVYTIEIVEPLARQAARTLVNLGYRSVKTRVGDGYQGWAEHAPYDSIMVTAAPRDVPRPLIEQLKPGGKLVVPVGGQSAGQSLLILEKQPDGTVSRRTVMAVRFVPLVDQAGKPQ
jgi:protein-L-isoaspartate(D-aspartate) O-methyltransferase